MPSISIDNPPKQRIEGTGPINEILDRLIAQRENLTLLRDRIAHTRERLLGPNPPTPSGADGGDKPAPSGLLDMINMEMNKINVIVQDLHEHIGAMNL